MHKRFHQGFTVVEIATVIFVIAVLALITTMTYNNVQKQSRDTARESAVTVIMTALEKYYDTHGEYPYGDTLNPSYELVKLTNYDAIYATLPNITADILNTGGYNFMPFACNTTGGCTATSAELKERPKQFFYYTQYRGRDNGSIKYSVGSNGLWGCEITFPTDQKPSAFIAYKRESDGKWIFTRAKHGDMIIANYSTGPVAPTVCEFTTI